MTEKKRGRPIIGQPKNRTLKIRLDEETYQMLIRKSKNLNISMAELIRRMTRESEK